MQKPLWNEELGLGVSIKTKFQQMLPSMGTANPPYISRTYLTWIHIFHADNLPSRITLQSHNHYTKFETFVKPRNIRLFDSSYKSTLKNFASSSGYLLL